MINGLKRAAALGAATVALAAGAVVGTVGTASAAPQDHPRPSAGAQDHHGPSAGPQDHRRPSAASHRCVKVAGHWARQWHPAYRDRHHRWHPGQWTRVWVPAHKECHHR
ncbi:hypothetical protein AB0M19_30155 [Streptomyces sp. NPDC051920]|uniref:hypothetical protein n=1 Tax=Streptomyces sp. NPDC051920 TaxID=3155523 RepID=UPI00343BE8EB